MPARTETPGVYVEEVESPVRTIAGVPTSVTAFVGRAKRGPVNDPVEIASYTAYERVFGGIWEHSPMSYAVQQFFLNGGAKAQIVRVENNADKAEIGLDAGEDELRLEADNPGAWGNRLQAVVGHNTEPKEDHLFNLRVEEVASDNGNEEVVNEETFRNVSVQDVHPREVKGHLEQRSDLVSVKGEVPDDRPDEHEDGDDPAGVEESDEGDDGDEIEWRQIAGPGRTSEKEGIWALEEVDVLNVLCIPPLARGVDVTQKVREEALKYAKDRRAMYIVDPSTEWRSASDVEDNIDDWNLRDPNAAIYFPHVVMPDPERDGRLEEFAPCGAVAGVWSRNDAEDGVWEAPAGIDSTVRGATELSVKLTDADQSKLNPIGVNCLRSFPGAGTVVWGSRTLRGADRLASEWKYLPVRRLALYIQESLQRGTKWAVFEPNDEPLWAQLRMNVKAFMQNLFRQGAFQGTRPQEAYFVKCDGETTTQNDIDRGIVNVHVGFAPLKPAEFVVLKISQMAGEGP